MEASFRYGGNDFAIVTGVAGSVRVDIDEEAVGMPLLDIEMGRTGDSLTPRMAEELGRILLAWAADMRLAGL